VDRTGRRHARCVEDRLARYAHVRSRAALSGLPSPASYTPKHLAQKILTSRAALEGERKNVTVLFADRKGSMELPADRDPEEARETSRPVQLLPIDSGSVVLAPRSGPVPDRGGAP